MSFTGVGGGDKEPRKFRFQVTPRVDIEAQSFHSSPSTPLSVDDPYTPNYFSPHLFKNLEDNEQTGQTQRTITLNNTATTTSTSSSSSFYNTIYKYNKLMQNDSNTSMEVLFRRPSNSPHSLVGIPFYNERIMVYNFIQRPTGLLAITYHTMVSLIVIFCLVLTILSTTSKYGDSVTKWLNFIDYIIVIFFVGEFVARLWASECVSYYRGWKGKVRFFKNPIRIIDICIIIVSLAVLISDAKGELVITSLRGIRLIQIFQMLRLDFKFRPWRMMASVVYSQRIHLAIVFYMAFLALLFISFLLYFVERNHNEDFSSLASTMWWAVITLCTVGYGDAYPKTPAGKLLACICSIVGVSIFALPAGILGTGLALKVQEQKRQLKISKRKQPAARLIQCAWKFYISEQELKRSFRQKFAEPLNIKCRSILWKRFETKQNKQKPIGQNEMYKLHFVFAVQLCIAKRDFVKAFKPYDIKDVLEQYAAGHADMSHKIRIMDHRLEKIQSNSISFKSQNEFRLRFATHLTKLEYEMQKIQMNFNELLQYQLNSRLVIGNLLKFLIDQQISIKNNGCQFGCNGSCAICRRTRAQCAKLSDEFEQIDLASQVNRVFSTYNQNILSHLKASNKGHQVQQRQPSFHRERRNSF